MPLELRMEQRARTIDRDELFELTPKAARVEELRAQFRASGKNEDKSFDEAFAIADREFTTDGLTLKPGQPTGTTVIKHGQEARAI